MQRRPTLWEWIVVLAIVLFVAAVLFPVFAKSHGGRHGSCLSNEKQLGLGLLEYAYDNAGLMPPATQDTKNTWRVTGYSYVKSNGVYQCPDDDRAPGPDGHYPSYAMNTGAIVAAPGAKLRTLSSAPHPETLVLLCEVQNTVAADFNIDTVPPAAHVLAVRHSDGGDYLLSDGHAKWFRPSAFTNTPPPVRWHRDPHRPLSANALAVLHNTP